MADRVDNEALLAAGLALMEQAGRPLTRVQTNTRAMKYSLPDGSSARIRTTNDHVLVVLAETAEPDARLNIEGTDFLLVVMPEEPRTPGPVIAYFVPTAIAVEAVRKAHAAWLASNPKTKGDNRTWNIWFDDDAAKSGGFAKKWAQYRLKGNATTLGHRPAAKSPSANSAKLGDVIAIAKQQIADAAGVSPEAVKITVELG